MTADFAVRFPLGFWADERGPDLPVELSFLDTSDEASNDACNACARDTMKKLGANEMSEAKMSVKRCR
jgi:hypothetical protein